MLGVKLQSLTLKSFKRDKYSRLNKMQNQNIHRASQISKLSSGSNEVINICDWRDNLGNKGVLLYLSFPFNFRLHNPLPDCFRISEFGIREILKDFEITELKCIYDESEPFFPIHYTVIAKN